MHIDMEGNILIPGDWRRKKQKGNKKGQADNYQHNNTDKDNNFFLFFHISPRLTSIYSPMIYYPIDCAICSSRTKSELYKFREKDDINDIPSQTAPC